jgi:hypothetical protein
MKKPGRKGIDVPPMQSVLAPLQRVLDVQLQAARCSLGARRQEAASLADQVQELRENERAALAEAAAACGRPYDPSIHRQALHHLATLARVRVTREADARTAEGKVSAAMKECVERDRKLAVVQRLQDRELQAQAALAVRRQSREADLDWLARSQGTERP